MSKHIDKVSPVELLDCSGKPFGLDVALTISEKERRAIIAAVDYIDRRQTLGIDADETDLSNPSLSPEIVAGIKEITRGIKQSIESGYGDTIIDAYSGLSDRPSSLTIKEISKLQDAVIANLTLNNVEQHRDLQESLLRDQAEINDDTIAKTEKLIEYGLFPKRAREQMERAIGHYGAFIAMDPFEEALEGCYGYTDFSGSIALGNLYSDPDIMVTASRHMAETAFHERLHSAGSHSKGGFLRGRVPFSWLEEASVTHAETVASIDATNHKIEVVSPTEREDDSEIYYEERDLLSMILPEDAANIPIDLLYEAFFADKSGEPMREVTKRLALYFQSLSGKNDKNALYTFSKKYEKAPTEKKRVRAIGALVFKIENRH